MDDKSLSNIELEALAAEVGEFIRYWGFKQVHGRIWTHLFVSSTPLDAGTLMKRLKVSKALMSLSLNDLLQYKVIVESKRSERGTHTYIANPNILDIIVGILKNREKVMLDKIERAFREVQPAPGIDPDRLRLLGEFIHQAQSSLDSVVTLSGEFGAWKQLTVQ